MDKNPTPSYPRSILHFLISSFYLTLCRQGHSTSRWENNVNCINCTTFVSPPRNLSFLSHLYRQRATCYFSRFSSSSLHLIPVLEAPQSLVRRSNAPNDSLNQIACAPRERVHQDEIMESWTHFLKHWEANMLKHRWRHRDWGRSVLARSWTSPNVGIPGSRLFYRLTGTRHGRN